jgi:thioredoxin-dependent peroxiredoxin
MPSKAPTKKPATHTEESPLQGKKAPAFELTDGDGNKIALKDLIAGKNLVLYFYPRDNTPGCTKEACSFRDQVAAIRKLGAQVVGVSGDSAVSHQKFTKSYNLNFPLLADTENRVGKAYGVFKEKSLYGRKFMGIERTTFIIDSKGVIRRVFPRVKVDGHSGEVIAALKDLS